MTGSRVAAWPKGIDAITLFVEDLAGTKRFYEQAFGLRAMFEDANSVVFDFGNAVVNLLHTTAVPELIQPAEAAPRTAGSGVVFTVEVDDVDAMAAQLADRGIEILNGPIDRPWGIRTASFRDPDGHIWEIARKIDRG
jgi:lactoylglutathione lyase